MKFIDTNIIFRFLLNDDQVKASNCRKLFDRLKTGSEEVLTSEEVISEAVYVLSSKVYGLSHEEIRGKLMPVISLVGLRLPHKRLLVKGLDIYANYGDFDFEDAVSIAYMERDEIKEIYSYDKDFDQLPQIKRIEP